MALQKEVRKVMSLGSAGEVSRALHSYFLPESAVAGDGNVCVGCFVKRTASTKEGEVVGASGAAVTTATDKIVGICIKGKLITSNTTPVHIYPKGETIQYVEKGSVFIESEATAKVGQYVFLKDADGSLAFDDNPTKGSHTYTGFKVSIGGTTSGETIVIEVTSEK